MKFRTMKKQLTIALVAHDKRKADMVEWAVFNAETLSKHKLVCTGTTGGLIQKAFKEKGVHADVTCMNSGPLGGDAEIAALVVRKQVNLAIFLIDDLITSTLWDNDDYVPLEPRYINFKRK
jgi:methylglyoxal synthase